MGGLFESCFSCKIKNSCKTRLIILISVLNLCINQGTKIVSVLGSVLGRGKGSSPDSFSGDPGNRVIMYVYCTSCDQFSLGTIYI